MGFAGRIGIDQWNHLTIDRHAVGKGILIQVEVFASGDLWLGGTQVPHLGVIPHPSVQFVQRRDSVQVPGIELEKSLVQVH